MAAPIFILACKYGQEPVFEYKYNPRTTIRDLCRDVKLHYQLGTCKFIGLKTKVKNQTILNDQVTDNNKNDYSQVLLTDCKLPVSTQTSLKIIGTRREVIEKSDREKSQLEAVSIAMCEESNYDGILRQQNQLIMQVQDNYTKHCSKLSHNNLDTLDEGQRQQLVEYKVLQGDLESLMRSSLIGGAGKVRIDLTNSMILAFILGRVKFIDYFLEDELKYIQKCKENKLVMDRFEPLTQSTRKTLDDYQRQIMVEYTASTPSTIDSEAKARAKLTPSMNQWLDSGTRSSRRSSYTRGYLNNDLSSQLNLRAHASNWDGFKEAEYILMACRYGQIFIEDLMKNVKRSSESNTSKYEDLDLSDLMLTSGTNLWRACVQESIKYGHFKLAKTLIHLYSQVNTDSTGSATATATAIGTETKSLDDSSSRSIPPFAWFDDLCLELALEKGYFDSYKYMIQNLKESNAKDANDLNGINGLNGIRGDSINYHEDPDIIRQRFNALCQFICKSTKPSSSSSSSSSVTSTIRNKDEEQKDLVENIRFVVDQLMNVSLKTENLTSMPGYRLTTLRQCFNSMMGVLVQDSPARLPLPSREETRNTCVDTLYFDVDYGAGSDVITLLNKTVEIVVATFALLYNQETERLLKMTPSLSSLLPSLSQAIIPDLQEVMSNLTYRDSRINSNYYSYSAYSYYGHALLITLIQLETKYNLHTTYYPSPGATITEISILNYLVTSTNLNSNSNSNLRNSNNNDDAVVSMNLDDDGDDDNMNESVEDKIITMKKEVQSVLDMSLFNYQQYHQHQHQHQSSDAQLEAKTTISLETKTASTFSNVMRSRITFISNVAKGIASQFKNSQWDKLVESLQFESNSIISNNFMRNNIRIHVDYALLATEFVVPVKKMQYLISLGAVPAISLYGWSEKQLKCLAIAHCLQSNLEAQIRLFTEEISASGIAQISFVQHIIVQYIHFYENRRIHEPAILRHMIPTEIYQYAINVVKLLPQIKGITHQSK